MFLKTQIEGFSIKIFLYDYEGKLIRNVKWGKDLHDVISSGSRFINDEGEYCAENIDQELIEFEIAELKSYEKWLEKSIKTHHKKEI